MVVKKSIFYTWVMLKKGKTILHIVFLSGNVDSFEQYFLVVAKVVVVAFEFRNQPNRTD